MTFDYDVIVLGGGSGGIACARECVRMGAKVALFDYVKPSPYGTKWGLGGTCVNVGCIPKKIIHYAALLGGQMANANYLGWDINPHPKMDWQKLVENVQNHVKSLNFGYRSDMMKNKIQYFNNFATFAGQRTIKYVGNDGEEKSVEGKKIVIATGGRPIYPDIPNAKELGITSDDIFSLETPPGKTLIVGASYISLETAGFLTELGFEVTIAVRSIVLRGFDRQCADRIADFMEKSGTKFAMKTIPVRLDKNVQNGKIRATLKQEGRGEAYEEEFDTVMFAAGRAPVHSALNLSEAGVKTLPNGKIDVVDEQTSNGHVFAIGDAIDRPELTPVAIQAGTLLANRLMGKDTEKMNYDIVPTTVFTPLEYGCIGMTEEAALEKYGKANIEVYHTSYSSTENAATHRVDKEGDEFGNVNFAKLICVKSEKERVVGLHYLGENAGEVTGGFAVALRLGATKRDFDLTVGIHPTSGEAFTTMKTTKSSGENYQASGC